MNTPRPSTVSQPPRGADAAQQRPAALASDARCAQELVLLRSAANPTGHPGVVVGDDSKGGLTLLVGQALPVQGVYNVHRPTQAAGARDALFVIEHSRPGSRAGEARLGHFVHGLRRLHPAPACSASSGSGRSGAPKAVSGVGASRGGTQARPLAPREQTSDRSRGAQHPKPGAELPRLEHPLLEQAAFDFATGHVLSAETALGLALRDEQSPEMACHLHQALLDLYWATQRHAELQAQSQAFRQRHGLAPVTRPELEPAKLDAHRTASFAVNGAVDRLQVRMLQRALADPAGHLVLDFSGLTGIAEDAREPLATVLIELKARQGDLELHGLDVLQAHIRLHNEPATATATAADATLRQLALRLSSDANALMVPARPSPASTPKQPRSARLGGEFTGGDDAFLQPLRTLSAHADSIVVDLQGLRRMDFTAATGLLNWVDAQQRLDKLVLLRGAHGLLAPLLQLVGLQLHA